MMTGEKGCMDEKQFKALVAALMAGGLSEEEATKRANEEKAMAGGMDDTHRLQQVVRRTIGRWVSRSLRRRPMIVPVVVKI